MSPFSWSASTRRRFRGKAVRRRARADWRREFERAGFLFADLFTVAGSLLPRRAITFRRAGGRYRVDVGNDQGPWADSLYLAITGWMAPASLLNEEGRQVAERRRARSAAA